MGHYILGAVDFGEDPSKRARDLVASASFSEIIHQTSDLSRGGIHFPYTEHGPRDSQPPQRIWFRKAATLGDSRDRRLTNPKNIVMKSHVNWGDASAQQLKGVLMYSEGVSAHLLPRVDEAVGQCEVCRASGKAPHAPVAGTSTVSIFNEELLVDLLFR